MKRRDDLLFEKLFECIDRLPCHLSASFPGHIENFMNLGPNIVSSNLTNPHAVPYNYIKIFDNFYDQFNYDFLIFLQPNLRLFPFLSSQ